MFLNNEVRRGDCGDKDTMIKTLTDVDKVLSIFSQPGGKVDRATVQKNVVDASVKSNVKFVVYTNFPKAENSSSWLVSDRKTTEEAIKKAGLHHSFLRNNWYLENEVGFLQSGADRQAALYWVGGCVGWVLECRYTRAAVDVSTAETSKEIYEFSGKRADHKDLGYALQAAAGNNFEIKHVSRDEYVKCPKNTGLKSETATLFASFEQPIYDGALDRDITGLTDVLGHSSLSLEAAIKKTFAR